MFQDFFVAKKLFKTHRAPLYPNTVGFGKGDPTADMLFLEKIMHENIISIYIFASHIVFRFHEL